MSGTTEHNAAPSGMVNDAHDNPEIEIIEAAPASEREPVEERRPAARKAEGDEDLSARVKKRMDRLTWRAKSAEETAAAREQEIAHLRAQLQRSGGAQVELFHANLDAQLETMREVKRKAMTEGDVESQIEADEKIAELKAAKMIVSQQQQQQPAPQQRQGPAPPPPEIEEWIAEHPWFKWNGGNPDRSDPATDCVVSAHERAVRRGLKTGSTKYLEFVDAAARREFPELYDDDAGEMEVEDDAPVRRPASTRPAAPQAQVRRTGQPGTAPARQTLRLTADQMEAARISGVTPQAYMAALAAANKRS